VKERQSLANSYVQQLIALGLERRPEPMNLLALKAAPQPIVPPFLSPPPVVGTKIADTLTVQPQNSKTFLEKNCHMADTTLPLRTSDDLVVQDNDQSVSNEVMLQKKDGRI
jgi:hypothetical protein